MSNVIAGFEHLCYCPLSNGNDGGVFFINKNKLSQEQRNFMEATLDFCNLRTTAFEHEDCFVYEYSSETWFTNRLVHMHSTQEISFNDIFK
jgi:hypothetical protein